MIRKEQMRILAVALISCMTFSTAFAQKTVKPFEKLSVGIGVTTFGPRLEVATSLNNHFDLRGGLSILPYSHKMDFAISTKEYRDYINYDPDLNVTGKLSFTHAHILADIKPMRNSLFYFTTGLFLGSSVLNVDGILVNPSNQRPTVDDLRDAGYMNDEMPEFTFEDDYVLLPNKDGSASGKLKMGNTIKPYLGFGIGRAIPNKKFGIKFELGAIYQGKPDITSPNLVRGNLNDYIDKNDDLKQYKPWISWYPMLNFQFIYRIY